MLKLRLEPATRPGTKEALARAGATGRFARKKDFEGPARAAIRSREVEDIFRIYLLVFFFIYSLIKGREWRDWLVVGGDAGSLLSNKVTQVCVWVWVWDGI